MAETQAELETVGADIIGQSPDNWQRLMIVNKGSSSGVKKYMAVVTERGPGRQDNLGRLAFIGGPTDNGLPLRDRGPRPAFPGDRHSRGAERRDHQVRAHERGRDIRRWGHSGDKRPGGHLPAGHRHRESERGQEALQRACPARRGETFREVSPSSTRCW